MNGQNCNDCPSEPFQTEFYIERDNQELQTGEEVCYTISTNNFNCAIALQIFLRFSSSTLEFNGVLNTDLSGIPQFGATVIPPTTDEIRILWVDQGLVPRSLPDSTALMEICFDVTGLPGVNGNAVLAIGSVPSFQAQLGYSFGTCPTVNDEPMGDANIAPIVPTCNAGLVVIANSICPSPIGQSTGSAKLEFFCGTGPYNVTIDTRPTVTTNDDELDVFNLAVGEHTFRVEDATGEVEFDMFTTLPGQGVRIDRAASTIQNPTCANGALPNGFVEVVVLGGSPAPGGFFYSWGGPNFGQSLAPDLSQQSNGSYTITVSDENGCTDTATFVLNTQPVSLTNVSTSPSRCDGVNTGIINASATGGINSDYQFEIDGQTNLGTDIFRTSNTGIFPNLDAGTYAVFVYNIDGRGICPSDSIVVTIGNEQNYNITVDPDLTTPGPCGVGEQNRIVNFTRDMQGSDVSFNITNIVGGATTLVTSGSVPTGSFSFETGCLPLGDYTLEMMDTDGCTAVVDFRVDGCDLVIDELAVFTLEPDCFDPMGGQIPVEGAVSGGQPPYNYEWNDGATEGNRMNLTEGTYSVTVTDQGDCEAMATFVLNPPITFELEFNVDSIACPNGTTDIVLAAFNGFAPYVYNWDFNPNDVDSILNNAPSGTYRVTVTDDGGFGCELDTVITIGEPTAPSINIVGDIVGPDCDGNGGALFMNVDPDLSLYPNNFNFEASSGSMSPANTTSFNPTNLGSGEQWVVVSTQEGCVFDTVFFSVPDAPQISLDRTQSDLGLINCFGEDTNVILVGEGSNSISYNWPAPYDGDDGFLKANVVAGTYAITLTAGFCDSVEVIEVTQPDSFFVMIDPNLSSLILCNGDLGDLEGIAEGGTPNYNLNWTDQSGTNVANGLSAPGLTAGFYTLTGIDNNGCQDFDTLTMTEPTAVMGSIVVEQPICFGDPGSVFVDTVFGGAGAPYRFQIDSNPIENVPDTAEVQSGAHSYILADRNNCQTQTESFTIDTPEEIELTVNGLSSINVGTPGGLNVGIIGPSDIDTIEWSNDSGEAFTCVNTDCSEITFNPIQDQIYTVLVTDINGCQSSTSFMIDVARNQNVFVANIFHPASTINEHRTLQVYTGSGVEIIDFFRIYDRWGNLVHEQTNLPPSNNGDGVGNWDGTFTSGDAFGGPAMESGVYVYVVQVRFLGDTEPVIFKGDVTLIR